MKKDVFKKILPYIVAAVVFIVLAIIYASPALEGKVLNAGDSLSGDGMVHETGEYHEETGVFPLWLGTCFAECPIINSPLQDSLDQQWMSTTAGSWI